MGVPAADLIEIVFDSRVAPGVPLAALQRLARHCATANPAAGITGFLRLDGGRFSVELEGGAAVLLPLAARILGDPRHVAIRVHAFGAIAGRRHSEWRIEGFDLDAPALLLDVRRDAAAPAIRGGARLRLVAGTA